MKTLGFIILLSFLPSLLFSQNLPDKPEDYFDFWLGKWDLTWKQDDGTIAKGTNIIEKTLDGAVIQENFSAQSGKLKGFKGTSISVFNPRENTWHQAWADNNGGYFNFIGKTLGNKRIFQTEPQALQNGNTIVKRMVFYNIKKNSFTWDWETSIDGGNSWELNWRIFYERAED